MKKNCALKIKKDTGDIMDVKFSLLVIGAGQLGSRYLQGIVNAKSVLDITVVDPSMSALELAKCRWIEAGGGRCHHQVKWVTDVPTNLKEVDLILVVTSSRGRADLVQRLASQIVVRYWVLEKVLAQSVEELAIITRSTNKSQGAWVNFPRRMMTWHQLLREKFISNGPMQVHFSSGYPELAGNTIHFVDLVSWWSGERPLSINTDDLSSVWFESKRKGYFEVCGKIAVQFSKGTTFIHSEGDQYNSNELILINNLGEEWVVHEEDGCAYGPHNQIIQGQLELQSTLSGRLVDGILLYGMCELPSVKDSVIVHSVFLEAMLRHWNFSKKRHDKIVPIT